MYSRKSYVVGGGRGQAQAGEQTEEKEAGGTGGRLDPRQGSGCGRDEGPDSGWVVPRGPRGGVWSLGGLAGQLLLVEAHDVVHELVLLTRLDHAAPARQTHSGDGVTEGPAPRSTACQSSEAHRGLCAA